MDSALLLERLAALADSWDRLADIETSPHSFQAGYRLCAGELRSVMREADTIPSPPPSVTSSVPPHG
jgi:hypothetical protein